MSHNVSGLLSVDPPPLVSLGLVLVYLFRIIDYCAYFGALGLHIWEVVSKLETGPKHLRVESSQPVVIAIIRELFTLIVREDPGRILKFTTF